MKNIKDIVIGIFAGIGFTAILMSFTSLNQPEKVDVIILKLMGKKLELAYVIDQGREDKRKQGHQRPEGGKRRRQEQDCS